MANTTQQHFKYYQRCCKKWLKKLGLVNWEITWAHDEGDGYTFASCAPCSDTSEAELDLKLNWPPGLDIVNEVIDQSAYHEVLHILLARLVTLANKRFVREEEIDDEEHQIIRALTLAQFKRVEVVR